MHSPGGHSAPVNDANQHLGLIGWETDMSSYVTVKYSRPLNSGDSNDKALTLGQTYSFAYCFYPGSPTMVDHGPYYYTYNIQLQAGATGGATSSTVKFSLIHGIILTVSWCLLADVAIMVVFLYNLKYKTLIHGLLMGIAVICSVVVIVTMIDSKQTKIDELSSTNKKAHYVIGLIVLGWTCLQFISGIISHISWVPKKMHPNPVKFSNIIHKYSGYVIMLVAKA